MRLSDLVACDCLALITFSGPDQARQIPDWGSNCLPRLTADDKSRSEQGIS